MGDRAMEKESQGVVSWCSDKMIALVTVMIFGIGSITLVIAVADFVYNVLQASIFGAFLPAR